MPICTIELRDGHEMQEPMLFVHWPIQKQDQTVTEKANVQVDDANNDSMKVWAGGRGTTATKFHGERFPDGAIRNRVACMKANS